MYWLGVIEESNLFLVIHSYASYSDGLITPSCKVFFCLWNLLLLLFSIPKFSVKEWQLGHNNWRFSSLLFVQSPSMWCIYNGTSPVYGFTSFHPHLWQELLYLSIKYLLTKLLTYPIPFSPLVVPDFHYAIYCLYSYSLEHFKQQYFLLLTPFVKNSFPQFKHIAIFFFPLLKVSYSLILLLGGSSIPNLFAYFLTDAPVTPSLLPISSYATFSTKIHYFKSSFTSSQFTLDFPIFSYIIISVLDQLN